MKKISMTLIAAMAIVFASCGGSTKTETPAEETKTETTTPAETNAPASSSDVLAKYEELVNKTIELAPKLKAGDAAAVQEYQTLSQEVAKYAQENATAFTSLSEADAKKYQELSQKLVDAFK